MVRILLLGLWVSAAVALEGGNTRIVPTVIDAGGSMAVSDDYQQFASGLGDIVATAVAGQDYSGRDAYVGQLPEPAVITLLATRYTVRRGDGPLTVSLARVGDEDDPVGTEFTLTSELDPPAAGLTPQVGAVDFATGALQAGLVFIIGEGNEGNVLLTLRDARGAAIIGSPSAAVITILSSPSAPPSGPLITSVPTLFTAQGEAWSYEVVVDPSGLGLPHALTPMVLLDFSLIDAPPGATIIKTGTLSARVSWPSVIGINEHRLIRLRVRDLWSGASDVQEVLLHVRPQPSGDG